MACSGQRAGFESLKVAVSYKEPAVTVSQIDVFMRPKPMNGLAQGFRTKASQPPVCPVAIQKETINVVSGRERLEGGSAFLSDGISSAVAAGLL